MKAFFSPGPSYFNTTVRQYAGWLKVYDLMEEALRELGYEVVLPDVPAPLIDEQTTVGKITSWDLVAASQMPKGVSLLVGPPGYSLAQTLVAKSRDAKVFLMVFNNADWWRDQQLAEEYKRFGRPYDLSPTWRWINRTALEMCDHVIACSPWVKWTHSKVVPEDKISISFWGVDSQMFTPAKEEPPGFRVLFVGGDPIRKGLGYLLEACREFDIDIWVVGCKIETTKGEVGLGLLPHSVMPELYRQCHVICLPTLEDGIALAIQEGMASGLVPITSPETAEVFEDGKSGIKVDYRDIEGIKNAIIMLKENPERRRAMAKEARALAEKQTWLETKRQFKEIIHERG